MKIIKTCTLTIALILSAIATLVAQSFSLEMSDTSITVKNTLPLGVQTLVNLKANRQFVSGELSLRGPFPEISLNNLQIADLGNDELGLDGDILPYSSTTYDLGNNVTGEHWDEVVANAFVSFVPPAAQLKSANQLPSLSKNLLKTQPRLIQLKNKEQSVPGFLIENLVEYLPQVLISEDYDYDPKTNTIVKKKSQVGINYNAFIPILVQTIQDQQAMIDQLINEIQQIKVTLSNQ